LTTSTVPYVVVFIALRSSGRSKCSPDACALSITAAFLSPRNPIVAPTIVPGIGPVTPCVINLPLVAFTSASTVPSPPSPIGHKSICTYGSASFNPAAIASATFGALRQSLNLSGATMILMQCVLPPSPAAPFPSSLPHSTKSKLYKAPAPSNPSAKSSPKSPAHAQSHTHD